MKAVLSCGDINGIGPEICIKSLGSVISRGHKYVVPIPGNVLLDTFSLIQPEFDFEIVDSSAAISEDPAVVSFLDIGNAKQKKGVPTKQSGAVSFRSLQTAFSLVRSGEYDALITAPISKEAFSLAGVQAVGHTGLLAEWCGVKKFAMLFSSSVFKTALLTIHVPMRSVGKLITANHLAATLDVVLHSLVQDFAVESPKAALLAFNPHAGENGIIGSEEADILIPFVKKFNESARKMRCSLEGPFSADAFFAEHSYKKYDVVIGMYHDQVLIPFKMLAADSGVNVTAGLPIIRTSPDHGTAFDIAYRGIANPGSMSAAIICAENIYHNRTVHRGTT